MSIYGRSRRCTYGLWRWERQARILFRSVWQFSPRATPRAAPRSPHRTSTQRPERHRRRQADPAAAACRWRRCSVDRIQWVHREVGSVRPLPWRAASCSAASDLLYAGGDQARSDRVIGSLDGHWRYERSPSAARMHSRSIPSLSTNAQSHAHFTRGNHAGRSMQKFGLGDKCWLTSRITES